MNWKIITGIHCAPTNTYQYDENTILLCAIYFPIFDLKIFFETGWAFQTNIIIHDTLEATGATRLREI